MVNFQDVSFTVCPGEVVALVGPSGGGKSTCVNLLEHFYETTVGQVLIDNTPIQQYDHKFLHEKVILCLIRYYRYKIDSKAYELFH